MTLRDTGNLVKSPRTLKISVLSESISFTILVIDLEFENFLLFPIIVNKSKALTHFK